MSTGWIVLGLFLVLLVGWMLVMFFVVRPRLARSMQASAEVLMRELHGKPPLEASVARCEGLSGPGKQVKGLGMLALTEHGVVFATPSPDETLIVSRDAIEAAGLARSFRASDSLVKRRSPMLMITWRNSEGVASTAGFSTSDAQSWVAMLDRSGGREADGFA